jgi:hypothetical protein
MWEGRVMDWANLMQVVYYVVGTFATLFGFYHWVLKRVFVTTEAFAEHNSDRDEAFQIYQKEVSDRFQAGSERMGELTRLIERVSQAIENLPTKDDVHDLALAMREVGGDLKAMRVSASAIEKDIDELRTTVVRHETIMADARGAR